MLRLGIGTCHDRDVKLDKAGWAAVYELGRRHALAPIVLDGVERLSIMQKPPADVVMPWIGLVQQVEAANRKLNRAAVMICDKFAQEGMAPEEAKATVPMISTKKITFDCSSMIYNLIIISEFPGGRTPAYRPFQQPVRAVSS